MRRDLPQSRQSRLLWGYLIAGPERRAHAAPFQRYEYTGHQLDSFEVSEEGILGTSRPAWINLYRTEGRDFVLSGEVQLGGVGGPVLPNRSRRRRSIPLCTGTAGSEANAQEELIRRGEAQELEVVVGRRSISRSFETWAACEG